MLQHLAKSVMGRKKRPRPMVRLLSLVCWWAVVARDAVEAHQHGRSRSSAAAFTHDAGATAAAAAAVRLRLGSTSTSRSSGAFARRPHLGSPLLQQQHQQREQRESQRLLRRGRNGVSRGQCLMGVAGLTSYVNKNLKGAVAMEDLREVSSGVVSGELQSMRTALWVACIFLPFCEACVLVRLQDS